REAWPSDADQHPWPAAPRRQAAERAHQPQWCRGRLSDPCPPYTGSLRWRDGAPRNGAMSTDVALAAVAEAVQRTTFKSCRNLIQICKGYPRGNVGNSKALSIFNRFYIGQGLAQDLPTGSGCASSMTASVDWAQQLASAASPNVRPKHYEAD